MELSYISGNGNPKKASYTSGNGIFQFRLEKISYTSGNGSPEKISYILTREIFSYISGNRTFLYFRKRKPLKTSYISGSNFPCSKNEKKKKALLKNFLCFGKMELFRSKLKKHLIYWEVTCNA